jgi:hypothetical protein
MTGVTIGFCRGSTGFGRGLAIALMSVFISSVIMPGPSLAEDWSKYEPKYSVGSGLADWWINRPDQSASAGTSVEHPQWVLDALKEKPVLIMAHTTDCSSCKIQKANIEKVLQNFSSDVTYYDILADGKDRRAWEILNIYNPTGGEPYVPTTVFITLVKGADGKVDVAWHSEMDDMTKEQLSAYLKDAIYYYRQNKDGWNK